MRDGPSLFRPEAVAEQQDRWLGRVVLTPGLGLSAVAGVVSVVTLGLIGLLAFGQSTQTERFGGWLAPGPGGRLEAHLFGPSGAIGEVRPGQKVLLRFDAFPYQRYGQHEGQVRAVLPAGLTAREVAEATGIPDLAQSGPLFRVEVELASRAEVTSGRPARLLPSMPLQADVRIRTRRLWEWVLDPGGSLSEREGGS